jgi:superfamily II DNA or RNA helicase
MLIRRARIIKGARQKVRAAVDVVMANYEPGQHWIVYCDDQVQLVEVRDAIRSAGCNSVFEYHTGMAGDQRQTLALFERQGGVVVSIRCLDEGVDIPAVSHALILASSKNPREYVQRRGRVLRKFENKAISHIHDVLVTPHCDPDEPPEMSILEGELARAIEFGSHAINPGCITDLERLAIAHGIDWAKLTDSGIEDDEEEKESE